MADDAPDLLEASADPELTALRDPATGQIQLWRKPSAERVKQLGLVHATPAELERRAEYLKNTTASAQATTAAKLAANVATFGLAGFNDPESLQQVRDFKTQSPTLHTLTELAGATAPMIASGGIAGAAGGALGLSARATTIGTLVAEELANAGSLERQHATEENRGIDAMNVIQGLPLAFGLSAASRLARGASRVAAEPLEGLAGSAARGAAEGVEAEAGEAANAISRGRATSRARRSVGAAGEDLGSAPLTEGQVKNYVDNFDDIHREAERVGGDAIEDALGGPAPTFDEVHSLKNKAADLDGKMTDAHWGRVQKEAVKAESNMNEIAAYLESKGQKQAATRARAYAAEVASETEKALTVGDAVHSARAVDRAKQLTDKLVSKYGASRDIIGEDIAEFVNERANRMRAQLEKKSIYGQAWSDYQRETNKLWAGNDGIIQSGRVWQAELLERSAMGRVRKGAEEFPVFQVRGDVVQHALGMTDREFKRTMSALDTWADKVEKMTLTKAELGANTMGHTPVMRLQQSVDDLRSFQAEVTRLREARYRGADQLARKAASATAHGTAEAMFEAAKHIPGVGHTLHTADYAAKKLTGKSIGERIFQPHIKPARAELTREGARASVLKRQGRSVERPYAPPSGEAIPAPGPQGRSPAVGTPAGSASVEVGRAGQRGSAQVGAMAAAAGVGLGAVAAAPAITDALAQLSDDNKAIRERAATGLVVKATRPSKLPPQISRFKEGASSLAAAYAIKIDDLQQALADPHALVNGIAEAYGPVADHHEELYSELVQRTAMAANYVVANAPPSVGISIVNPDGVAPDTLALASFAQTWSGAMNPGDVVYDIGTGDATPTQIKALREVHPDIYDAIRTDVLKQVDRATMPFESLRQLDVLFDLPGIAGPAFSPDMTKTMQQVWKQPATPSKSAASGAQAPNSATAQFAAGPSRMQ